MDEETVTLAVGDRVAKGQALGQIVAQIQDDGDDTSHLHFGVAVCGPKFTYDGVEVPKLWYLIDPFGVYDYRMDDTTYVPRTAEGMWLAVRGAERRVQWSSIVPAEALPVERLTDGYETIERIQVRVRRNDTTGGGLPPEHDQFIVWLTDESMFFVPLREARDATMETVLAETLRDAFMQGKKTRLGYRFSGRQRLITAA